MPQKPDEGLGARTAEAVKPRGPAGRVEAPSTGPGNERLGSRELMERVYERPNLQAALKRVRQNAGSPGIDGMRSKICPVICACTGRVCARNCLRDATSRSR